MFSRPLSSLSISNSTLSALKRAGFDTVDDLGSLTADQLSEELKLPAFLCEEVLRATQNAPHSLTQHAASLLESTTSTYSVSDPVDAILGDGGLKKGHVLEMSGPPGSPKELALLGLIKSVVSFQEEVIFLNAQNAIVPSTLKSSLKDIPQSLDRIHYIRCYSLPKVMAFIYSIPDLLEKYPKTSLIVLNTLSFLFHATPLSNSSRSSLLEQIKIAIAKACAYRHVTIAVTVQLATRMVGADGSIANFDTAKKAIMVPQLGDTYLPAGKAYRVMFIPNAPSTGMIRLLASPSRTAKQLQETIIEEPYEMIDGRLSCRSKGMNME